MPGSLLKQFDPGQFLINWSGIPFGGYAEGTMAKLVKNKPDYTMKPGSTGEQLVVFNRDKSGYLEVHLLQSSSTNDALSAKRKIALAGGPFTGALLVRDLNGTTEFSGEQCFLESIPESEWGDEGKDRVWKIIIPDLDAFIGGNTVAV
jgi:hypothetical protein